MKLVAISIFTLLLAACTSTPVATSEASEVGGQQILDGRYLTPTVDSGKVVVKRDRAMALAACSARVIVNAAPVADLGLAEKITLHLPAGDHIIGVVPSGICGGSPRELATTVKAGKTTAFRVIATVSNGLTLNPTAFE